MYRLNRNESNPFQSPRANPKHASRQVNGETEPSQLQKIIKVQTRKRT
ncbi:hypothetical protein BN1058_01519 [Paraliobacillus sp. PM-2]|nr:YpzG family protein [Paraliobacillus sp. PM-2]CQR47213.1 hypothetical protein BN1058_01519 [Paraliobacillus sp. PM-2]